MLKLNVCPFCGGEAELTKDEFGRYSVFSIGENCGAVMVGFKKRQEVIDSWNVRVERTPTILTTSTTPKKESKYNDVCTIREMANRLHDEKILVTESALRRLITTGQLPAVKVGNKALISYRNTIELIEKGNLHLK